MQIRSGAIWWSEGWRYILLFHHGWGTYPYFSPPHKYLLRCSSWAAQSLCAYNTLLDLLVAMVTTVYWCTGHRVMFLNHSKYRWVIYWMPWNKSKLTPNIVKTNKHLQWKMTDGSLTWKKIYHPATSLLQVISTVFASYLHNLVLSCCLSTPTLPHW